MWVKSSDNRRAIIKKSGHIPYNKECRFECPQKLQVDRSAENGRDEWAVIGWAIDNNTQQLRQGSPRAAASPI